MRYWLIKSEPKTFSIDDLQQSPSQITHWDGVRNYQARNFMMRDMQIGDLILFYHSNCTPPGIIGIAEVVSDAYPDHTAYDPHSEHPDPKSTPENPRWFMVDIRFKKKFSRLLSLDEMRHHKDLKEMLILRRGNRLSITPIQEHEWYTILNCVS